MTVAGITTGQSHTRQYCADENALQYSYQGDLGNLKKLVFQRDRFVILSPGQICIFSLRSGLVCFLSKNRTAVKGEDNALIYLHRTAHPHNHQGTYYRLRSTRFAFVPDSLMHAASSHQIRKGKYNSSIQENRGQGTTQG